MGENYVGLFGTQVRMLEGSSNFMDSAATCHREGGRLNFLAMEEEALALRILSGKIQVESSKPAFINQVCSL